MTSSPPTYSVSARLDEHENRLLVAWEAYMTERQGRNVGTRKVVVTALGAMKSPTGDSAAEKEVREARQALSDVRRAPESEYRP